MATDETLAQAVKRLADEWQRNAAANERAGHFPWAMWQNRANDLRALLAEYRDESPAPEPPSDVTVDDVASLLWDRDARNIFRDWDDAQTVAIHILTAFHVTPRSGK